MSWTECRYSKSRVRAAGHVLVANSPSAEELSEALEILSNWRSAHAYPMHAILMLLRDKAKEIEGRNAITVQRLKRTPSIIAKLNRYSTMSLDGMQDIGGCRAVMPNVAKTRRLYSRLRSSSTRHQFHNEKDYISEPKDSGYRGIHLIYKYNGSKRAYVDFRVEIQLRSQVQHSWATAVEVVDTFTGQALKSDCGDGAWKEFFAVAGSAFALLEGTPIDPRFEGMDLSELTRKLEHQLNVIQKLRAFAVTAEHINKGKDKKSEYFLLQLRTKESAITIYDYNARQLEWATNDYLFYEKSTSNDSDVDVVLVSASTIKNLKKAYPNYFADTDGFVRNLLRVIGQK